MKNISISFLLLTIAICGFAQTTITLQPDATAGKDAMIDSKRNTANFGTYDVLPYWAWTNGGSNTTGRSLLDFNLSAIPSNATILSATLTLYSIDHPAEGNNSTLSGTNEGYIQRITSGWNETSVNWDNQPSTTATNQGTIVSSNNYNDILSSDVKNLVIDYLNNPTSSFGFMTRLQTESAYRRIVVASSDYADPTKRPKLQITYKIVSSTDTCIVIKRNAEESGYMDAMTDSNRPTANFGTYDVIPYWTWTNSGNTTIGRSYLKFPLTAIPSNAVITGATLTLSSVDHAAEGSNSQISGSNDGIVNRVTENWVESTINWNNKPATTSTNASTVPASSNATDVFSVDVKNIVTDMMANPSTSFGFMLQLNTEVAYRRIVIASFENVTVASRPKLEVCYKKSVSNGITLSNYKTGFSVFPNPTSKTFTVDIKSNFDQQAILTINDINGKKIVEEKLTIFTGSNLLNYNIVDLHLATGVYTILLNNNAIHEVQKLIIN